ncbi:13094_t:CDS:2, partial [Acaulospora colombiana]
VKNCRSINIKRLDTIGLGFIQGTLRPKNETIDIIEEARELIAESVTLCTVCIQQPLSYMTELLWSIQLNFKWRARQGGRNSTPRVFQGQSYSLTDVLDVLCIFIWDNTEPVL